MATTFNFELNNKPTKNNTYVVQLRITQDKKHKRVKTSVEVKDKNHFNRKARQGNWISKSEPKHAVWNEALEKELENAKEKYRDLKESGLATKEKIASAITEGERSLSFVKYAKQRTQEIYNQGSINNFKKYRGFCNKLEGYLTGRSGQTKDLTFNEITPAFLSGFQSYLTTLPNERDPSKRIHQNSIFVILNIFKTLLRRAIEVDSMMKYENNPFLKFKYKATKTSKDKLNIDEVRAIENLPLPEGGRLRDSRNCFLFSFYCAGIRIGDLLQLRWLNITPDNRLHYEMDKNGKYRDIKLIPPAIDILNYYRKVDTKPQDYIFPYLESGKPYAKAITMQEIDTMSIELKVQLKEALSAKSTLVRKYLTKVAKMAGIEKSVTPHIARHTFARIAKDNNIDNGIVQSLLAHENSRTTDNYMGNFDTSIQDNAMDKIFGLNKSKEDALAESIRKAELTPEQEEAIRKILLKK